METEEEYRTKFPALNFYGSPFNSFYSIDFQFGALLISWFIRIEFEAHQRHQGNMVTRNFRINQFFSDSPNRKEQRESECVWVKGIYGKFVENKKRLEPQVCCPFAIYMAQRTRIEYTNR